MVWLEELLSELPPAGAQRPHPRFGADAAMWRRLLGHLSEGHCTLLGLWGEPAAVHLAVESEGYIAVATLACPDQRFPSVGRMHPPALRLERALSDLYNSICRSTACSRRSVRPRGGRSWLTCPRRL